MIPSLSQEALTQYASNAQTIQEPTGADYSRGVSVGRTIPAKWWNWLFSNATKRIVQSRSDADNMLTEMKNVVTDAGLTPSGSNNTQLAQAVEAKANAQISSYLTNRKEFMSEWYDIKIVLGSDTLIRHSNSNLYPALRNIKLVEGLYFAEVYGWLTNGTFKGTYACSKDLTHWTQVLPYSNYNGSINTVGVLYFNGAWYVTASGSDSITCNIYKSTNGTTWSTVQGVQGGGGVTAVVNNKLYFFTFPTNTTTEAITAFSTLDGATWSSQSITNLSSSIIFEAPDNACGEVIHLSASKYLIGAIFLVDLAALNVTYLSSVSGDGYVIAFNGAYYLPAHTSTAKITTDGAVTTLNYSLNGFSSNSEVLFRATTAGITGYSFSEAEVHNFPDFKSLFPSSTSAKVYNVIHTAEGWFLAVYDTTNPNFYNIGIPFKVLKASALSENIADYTVVYTSTSRDINGAGSYLATAALYITEPISGVISINGAWSKDGGITWVQSSVVTALSVTAFSPELMLSVGDYNFYGSFCSGGSGLTRPKYTTRLFTSNVVNKVIGHTLYLR